MHELSIMESVLEMAHARASQENAARIHRIVLRIGDGSGVSLDALTFAFEVLARDTSASDAELVVERVPALCRCGECGTDYEPHDPLAGCSACGALRGRLIQGRELELCSLEVS
jgi:hydrogenase nickel incorporation protein HypA/HybF